MIGYNEMRPFDIVIRFKILYKHSKRNVLIQKLNIILISPHIDYIWFLPTNKSTPKNPKELKFCDTRKKSALHLRFTTNCVVLCKLSNEKENCIQLC